MKRNILKNISLASIERILQLGISLLLIKIIAKYLSPEQFGGYQYALAIISIASAISWVLPLESVYSQLNTKKEIPSKIFAASFWLRFLISTVVYIGLFVGLLLIKSPFNFESYLIAILGLSIIHIESSGLLRFQLEAKGYFRQLSMWRITSAIIKVILFYLLILGEINPLLVLSLIPLEQLLNSFVYFIYIKKININIFKKIHVPFPKIKNLISRGLKYWIGLILMYGFLKFDKIFLSHKININEFANFSAASNLNDQLITFFTIMIGSIAPIAIYSQATKNVHATIKKIMFFAIPTSIAVTVFLSFISPLIIKIIFSDKYLDAINIFNYYLIIFPLVTVDLLLSIFMYKLHLDNIFLIKWISAFIINVIITIILFPSLGYYAALIGNAAGYSINILIGFYIFNRQGKS